MDWVWPLYEKHVLRNLESAHIEDPADSDFETEFVRSLSASTVTVLVQEPWRGSVRFKTLARFDSGDMFDLLNDPEPYLLDRFGGGKFKLNFHEGLHFVATRNFKPAGDPLWIDLPELELHTTE